jgi:hypothetical protein
MRDPLQGSGDLLDDWLSKFFCPGSVCQVLPSQQFPEVERFHSGQPQPAQGTQKKRFSG